VDRWRVAALLGRDRTAVVVRRKAAGGDSLAEQLHRVAYYIRRCACANRHSGRQPKVEAGTLCQRSNRCRFRLPMLCCQFGGTMVSTS